MALTLRHLITGLVFMAALLGSHAAHATPTAAKNVSLRFTVFALGGAKGVAFRPKSGKRAQVLRFYSAYRSVEYAYRGPERLEFFDETATGEDAAPIALYDIPEGATTLLLLFTPRRETDGTGLKYDVYGIDDDVAAAPAGYFRTINLSGREYVAQYAGNDIAIPKGAGAIHSGNGRVALRLAARVEGHWMPTGRHEFTMTARDRVTLIFYPPASPTAAYPIVRRLTDTIPAPADAEDGLLAQNPDGA